MHTEFILAPSVREQFPQAQVLRFEAVGLRSHLPRASFVAERMSEARTALAARVDSVDALLAQPEIVRWREACRQLGANPNRFRCSVEALARRALAAKPVATGIPWVDLYNAASVRHLACLGAYDLEKLGDATVELRHAQPGTDRFLPLGAAPEDFPLSSTLVLYAQASKVLCWGFNVRDSADTCLETTTDEAVFVAEAVSDQQARQALAALRDLRELLLALDVHVTAVTVAA